MSDQRSGHSEGGDHQKVPAGNGLASPKGVLLIAEAGVNHNGSVATALEMVDVAAHAGVDAVKFQVFRTDALTTAGTPKAAYSLTTTDATESHRDMLARLELPDEAFLRIRDRCASRGIEFMATPFDRESLAFLVETADVDRLKIASGEITNGPLLLAAARAGRPMILSTGMSTVDEIRDALHVLVRGITGKEVIGVGGGAAGDRSLGAALAGHLTLLHCTSEYPAPYDSVNLRAMESLGARFGLPVGYSDHTPGIEIAVAAAARGAVVIEKHFTLDQDMGGPDHRASLEPRDLEILVRAVRNVEAALGDGAKSVAPVETDTRTVIRKSLVAARAIRNGERFTEALLTAKRPGTGVSPMQLWDFLQRTAKRDYKADDPIVDE